MLGQNFGTIPVLTLGHHFCPVLALGRLHPHIGTIQLGLHLGFELGKKSCPEGSIQDRGAEDVQSGLGDGALGHVIHTIGYRQGKREVYCFVGGILLEGEGVYTRDVTCLEGRAIAVAGRHLNGGGINEADESAGILDGNVFRAEEPGVIAAMTDKELMFDASIRVRKGAALWLEDGVDTFVRRHDVEPCKEVVIHQSNDALCCGK